MLDQLAVGFRAQRCWRVRVLQHCDNLTSQLISLHVVSVLQTQRQLLLSVLHVPLDRLEQNNALLVIFLRTGGDARWNHQRNERIRRIPPPLPIQRENLIAGVLLRSLQSRVVQEGVSFFVAVEKQITKFDFAVNQPMHILHLSTHPFPHAQLFRTTDLQLEELLFCQR